MTDKLPNLSDQAVLSKVTGGYTPWYYIRHESALYDLLSRLVAHAKDHLEGQVPYYSSGAEWLQNAILRTTGVELSHYDVQHVLGRAIDMDHTDDNVLSWVATALATHVSSKYAHELAELVGCLVNTYRSPMAARRALRAAVHAVPWPFELELDGHGRIVSVSFAFPCEDFDVRVAFGMGEVCARAGELLRHVLTARSLGR